jgi:adenylate cyclase
VGETETRIWQEAGLYDPSAPGAAERRALLEYLDDRGATVEQMVQAHRLGSLPGLAGDLVMQHQSSTESVSEIAARRGVEESRIMRALLAAGVPASVNTDVSTNLVSLLDAFEQGSALMGDEPILAFTRVMGAAATSIAEAAIALFFTEMGPGTLREGPDELARARQAEAATRAFTAVPEVMSRLIVDAFIRAERRAELARHGQAAQVGDGPPDGPTEVIALGFVDLVGSTAWSQTLNLRDQNLALTRFESAAWSSAVLSGGRVIKTIGDEVFFAAPTVEAACTIGADACRAADEDPLLPPARGAVGIGSVTPREGDYFGPLVNLLARLVKVAAPGGLVVTESAAAELPPRRWSLRPTQPLELRGIEGPIRAFHVEQ